MCICYAQNLILVNSTVVNLFSLFFQFYSKRLPSFVTIFRHYIALFVLSTLSRIQEEIVVRNVNGFALKKQLNSVIGVDSGNNQVACNQHHVMLDLE